MATAIETPFGTMFGTFTSSTDAYIEANSDGKFITINGLRVCAVIRLKKEDGIWVNSGWNFLGKKDWKNTRDMDLTASQSRKVYNVLVPFLCDWASNQDDSMLARAEINAQDAKIDILVREIEKLQAQVEAKTNELAEAFALRAAADARLAESMGLPIASA